MKRPNNIRFQEIWDRAVAKKREAIWNFLPEEICELVEKDGYLNEAETKFLEGFAKQEQWFHQVGLLIPKDGSQAFSFLPPGNPEREAASRCLEIIRESELDKLYEEAE